LRAALAIAHKILVSAYRMLVKNVLTAISAKPIFDRPDPNRRQPLIQFWV